MNPPATLSYYRTILARAYAVNPSLLVDEALFQALLLVLVAKQKHLIVRTVEENVPRALKHVVTILHTLFSLSVVKLRLRHSDKLSPDDFLRLLFLESPLTASRTSSRKTLNGAGNHAFVFKRSSSCPVSAVRDTAGADELFETPRADVSEKGMHYPIRSVMCCERRTSMLRAQTDPLPSVLHEEARLHEMEPRLLPQVLAVSGLEYTSEQVQSALWTSMSDRRISLGHDRQRVDHKYPQFDGVWQLPDDFLVVYVCPTDGYERPPVHRSLIDRFAMNVEVFPPAESVSDSRMPPLSPSDTDAVSPKSILSPFELADLRLLASPAHTLISWRHDLYLSDLLSAARHHPHLDGMLLTARCRAETVHLLRAWRVLFGPAPDGGGHAPLSLDVSDEDVRNVFVRAAQHRLRVLGGPRQEALASLIFRAAGENSENAEWETGRRTVKEVLREIIETV